MGPSGARADTWQIGGPHDITDQPAAEVKDGMLWRALSLPCWQGVQCQPSASEAVTMRRFRRWWGSWWWSGWSACRRPQAQCGRRPRGRRPRQLQQGGGWRMPHVSNASLQGEHARLEARRPRQRTSGENHRCNNRSLQCSRFSCGIVRSPSLKKTLPPVMLTRVLVVVSAALLALSGVVVEACMVKGVTGECACSTSESPAVSQHLMCWSTAADMCKVREVYCMQHADVASEGRHAPHPSRSTADTWHEGALSHR
jgi:hypothetical protein